MTAEVFDAGSVGALFTRGNNTLGVIEAPFDLMHVL